MQALLRADTLRLMLPSLESAGGGAGTGNGPGGGAWPLGDGADAMGTPSFEARQAQAAVLQLRAAAQAQQQAAQVRRVASALTPSPACHC